MPTVANSTKGNVSRQTPHDGLRNSISGARGKPIDAADWIIPGDVLNLDLAVSGMIRNETTDYLIG